MHGFTAGKAGINEYYKEALLIRGAGILFCPVIFSGSLRNDLVGPSPLQPLSFSMTQGQSSSSLLYANKAVPKT